MAILATLIQSIQPANQSKEVPIDINPMLVFSKGISSVTLNELTIKLEGVAPIPFTYTYHGMSRTLTIKPSVPLDSNQVYKITIVGGALGVQSTVGDTMSKDFVSQFTTVEVVSPPEEPDEPELPEEPEEPETPIEPTPVVQLSLINSYPKSGNILPSGAKIQLAFSLAINPESLSNAFVVREASFSGVIVNGSPPLPIDIQLLEDGTVVEITPTIEREGWLHDLIIKKSLTSLSGLSLAYPITMNFYSNYPHFYSTVKDVRLLAGSFADNYTDEQITEMIGTTSHELYNFVQYWSNFNEANWTVTVAPFGAKQYIDYSIFYKMAFNQSLFGASGQSSEFTLAELSIGGSSSTSSKIADLLELIQAQIDKWWKHLKNMDEDGSSSLYIKAPGSATRGITDYPHPDFQTRVPFTDLGG